MISKETRKLAEVSPKAKRQFAELMKNPYRNLPDTAPARMAYENKNHSKSKALLKLKK